MTLYISISSYFFSGSFSTPTKGYIMSFINVTIMAVIMICIADGNLAHQEVAIMDNVNVNRTHISVELCRELGYPLEEVNAFHNGVNVTLELEKQTSVNASSYDACEKANNASASIHMRRHIYIAFMITMVLLQLAAVLFVIVALRWKAVREATRSELHRTDSVMWHV